MARRAELMPGVSRAVVQATARALVAEAQRRAPVYRGTITVGGAVPGLLRDSIRAGSFNTTPAATTASVGPRGARVHLYSGKEERRSGFMAAATAATQSQMEAIAVAAVAQVWR
jgi:hypothetical protein